MFSVLDANGNLKGIGAAHTHAESEITGLVADLAAKQGIPASSAPTTTGTQTAFAIPTGTGPLTIYANNASLLTVQGIAPGIASQLLFIFSKGAGQIDFQHLHASGTAAGKLKLFATSGRTSLAPGVGVAVFQYDATVGVTQWRLVAHEQGAGLTPAYAAGNFSASAGAWTVDAGDYTTFRYVLNGTKLTVDYAIDTTSVSGLPANLQMTLPTGFTANGGASASTMVYLSAGGGWTTGGHQNIGAGSSLILLQSGALGVGTWANATNNTYVRGQFTLEVQ